MPTVQDLAAKVSQAYPAMASYAKELVETAGRLQIDPAWLANIISVESRGDPTARNASTDASGLIQFIPPTAAGLGTTTAAIRAMSGQQQMVYVEKYFQKVINQYGALKSQEDVVAAVFFPAYIGKPFETFSARIQELNRGMQNIRQYTTFLVGRAKLPVEGIGFPGGGNTGAIVGWSVTSLVLAGALVGALFYASSRRRVRS